MNQQTQKVGEGAEAYQAGRDITVNAGISPDQMTEIMVSMARQLAFFQVEAQQKVDERLASFQEEILKKFSEPGDANPEAFRDPDFQYLLGDAQKAYARSGDDAVRDTLIDIIARRSLEADRTRISVTLNDAATRAPLLTVNEFAELSLVYVLRYTIKNGLSDFSMFCNYVKESIIPFVHNVSEESSSYWHLESQSLVTIEITQLSIGDIWKGQYPGLLGKGFSAEQVENILTNPPQGLLIPCIHDASKLQPNTINRKVFLDVWSNKGVTEDQLNAVWNLFESTIVTGDAELVALLEPNVRYIGLLFRMWNTTPLKNMKLNSVGIAIAHANAVRVTGFSSPLNIWIK